MSTEKLRLNIKGPALFVLYSGAIMAGAYALGPITLILSIVAFLFLRVARVQPGTALGVAVLAMVAGMIYQKDWTFWISAPVYQMLHYYGDSAPEWMHQMFSRPSRFSDNGGTFWVQTLEWLQKPRLWRSYTPTGVFCGAVIYALLLISFPTAFQRRKPMKAAQANGAPLTPMNANGIREADTPEGSVIGTDKYSNPVELTDKAANQHTLVLGTTGSGKTVTVCNIVESAINRDLPLIYIDGKGDYDLAKRVVKYAEEKGRPVSIFSMRGDSVKYNPLATGGFTSKKDRIIELREWTEEHYKKLAEGYLQSVFKVMDACGIPCNLVSLAEHLDIKKLKALVRENKKSIPNAQRLMDELGYQDKAAESVDSLTAEIHNFAASEIGPLFQVEEDKPVLTLTELMENKGIAYFCLPALEFPSMSQTLGKLIINDLKATMAQQLAHGVKNKLYVIFDEFSVFAGEQVLNVINMGRSAGIHAILSTQSLSDIAAGRKDNADHFINQVIANCNNFVLHRQNSAEDAEKLAAMIGTRKTLEYTAQVNELGPTHMGSVRQGRGFISHPDEIKGLKTGEAFYFSKETNKSVRMKARKGKI